MIKTTIILIKYLVTIIVAFAIGFILSFQLIKLSIKPEILEMKNKIEWLEFENKQLENKIIESRIDLMFCQKDLPY